MTLKLRFLALHSVNVLGYDYPFQSYYFLGPGMGVEDDRESRGDFPQCSTNVYELRKTY